MQHSILACLLVGTALSVTAVSAVKAAPKRSTNAVVPFLSKPTVKLPTPHSHLGATEPISCKKLDMCLAHVGTEDKSEAALKTCVQTFCEELQKDNALNMSESRKALCNEKGKKVWDILSKASNEGSPVKPKADRKTSLVALHSSRPDTYAAVLHVLFAQSSTVTRMDTACRMVPVPAKPTVKLPTPHGHPEAGSAQAPKEVVLAKPTVASSHKVPVPEEPTVKLPTPHGHPESGSVHATKVTVPPKPNVTLPKPHGHAGSKPTEPVSCKKLDACLAAAHGDDQEKSASEFKACIESFCKELHNDKDLNKSDSRTALCDKKGKEAWDILAKAGSRIGNKKMSLVNLRRKLPHLYPAMLNMFFARSSRVFHTSNACHMHSDGAALSRSLLSRNVPVPAKPTVKLPTPHGHPEAASLHAAGVGAPARPKVVQATKVPANPTVKWLTPHGHPEAGSLHVAGVGAPARPKVVQAAKVSVPAKPTATLPKLHGLIRAKLKEEKSCKKLDACLAKAGAQKQEKSASQFKTCIQSFCEKLYSDSALNKSDTRTALCDEKGKEAWDILSKAGALFDVKANQKASLIALRSRRPDTYAAVLHVLFAQSSEVIRMDSVCQLHGDSAASQPASRRQSIGGPPKKEKNLRPIGEGAHQDPKAVQQRTTEKNMDCEDGNWNDCHGPGGDYTNSSHFPKPAKKSGAAPVAFSIGVTLAIIFAIVQ